MRIRYFPGLNGLRFIAAFIVLISHVYQSVSKVGIAVPFTVFFERGAAAVDFFFTLSGFLITYLLLQEHHDTGTISIRGFYMRRIRRIWPLYYVILFIGFLAFALIYPRVFHARYFEFPLVSGFLMYMFFLPNVMRAFFKVGLLNPLWSIGVEEQFYLFWAPLNKLFRRRLFPVVLTLTLVVAAFHAMLGFHVWTLDTRVEAMLTSFRFHYMGVGALFAYALFTHSERLLKSWLTTYWFQAVTIAVLLWHYLALLPFVNTNILDLPLAFLYGSLIVNVSAGPRRRLNLEWQPINYLGKISYGIYMFHMTVEYAVRTVYTRMHFTGASIWNGVAYGAVMLGATILLAHLSYQYFESRFLKHPAPAPQPSQPAVEMARAAFVAK